MAQLAVRAITPVLTVENGNPTCLSTDVARHFGKRHERVLSAIRTLMESLPDDHKHNFVFMLVPVQIGGGATRQDPAFRLTRDGFTLIAMGFSGQRALQFKLAYIDAFNKMEAQLRSPEVARYLTLTKGRITVGGKELRNSDSNSGYRTRQTMRFFCARTLLRREGGSHTTPLWGKAACCLLAVSNLPTPTGSALRNVFPWSSRPTGDASMSDLVGYSTPVLAIVDGIPTTTSSDVARHFGKRHEHVVDAIRRLLSTLPAKHHPNFRVMFSTVQIGNGATRQTPAYTLTRDGFTLLAMGFTGKRALQFKLAYIDAFNKMEAQLRSPEPESRFKADTLIAMMAEVRSQAQKAPPSFDPILFQQQTDQLDKFVQLAEELAGTAVGTVARMRELKREAMRTAGIR